MMSSPILQVVDCQRGFYILQIERFLVKRVKFWKKQKHENPIVFININRTCLLMFVLQHYTLQHIDV